MPKFNPTLLLILQCCIYCTAGQQEIDLALMPSVGTVSFKGQRLQVFEVDGVQIAEPRISFDGNCGYLRYNRMFQKYQITLPFRIEVDTLVAPTESSKKSGKVTLVGLKMIADKDLVSADSQVKAKMQLLTDLGEAELLLLCDSYEKCNCLMEEIDTNPDELTVRLVIVGKVGGSLVKFAETRILSTPRFHCHNGQWEVFQQRLDGNLSFAQSWDAYEKGFGNPKSNYWMGLRLLSAKTVTGSGVLTSRCQLRMETTDFNNKNYWAEYRFFQVLGPEENYRLRISAYVAGSTLPSSCIEYHNDASFSTFDRDHDTATVSCSRHFGYGGWWFKNCGQWHLNSAYPYDKTAMNDEAVLAIIMPGVGRLPMKSSKMMLKCNY